MNGCGGSRCALVAGTLPQRENIVHPEHLVSSRGDAGAIPVLLDDQQESGLTERAELMRKCKSDLWWDQFFKILKSADIIFCLITQLLMNSMQYLLLSEKNPGRFSVWRAKADVCLGRIGKQIDQNVFVDCCFVVCLPSRPSMSEVPCRKRDDYLEWPEYFMAVAFLSAQRSKDPNSQVGACIVNAENKIVGIGYNGMPNGCSDDLLPWRRTAENILDTKYPYVCHAELNAIMNKNSADVKGCTMYVALFPCNECAKLIIQAGIKEVIFMSDKYHDSNETTAARLMFEMAGISFRKFTPKCSQIVIDFDSINSRPSQKLQ
ncbi:hypothetical protein JEQ12_013134 [Ovis aries]|uniref:Deoxycytidylate deaminase n=2 Tax=Caprinae TaxID=9963 RepID=A0A836CPQ6_SHEEP|nr:hypothetical protein JEQ12_013134 [Ovis aries]